VYTVAINVLSAFHPESQYFIPLFLIKFHYFADNSQEGVKHHIHEGNSGPRGHDFMDDNSSMFQKVPKFPNFFGSRNHKICPKKKGNIDKHHGLSIPNLNS
jgi:hypothetical protein